MALAESSVTKPVPEPDDVSRPFFEGANEGRLMIQRCDDCRSFLPPGSTTCTECLSESLSWTEASGRGEVFTFGVMHQLYHPGFEPEIPYVVAVIELEEGPRLNSNIVDAEPSEVRVGDAVSVVFDEVAPGVHLPKFRRTS